MLPSDGAILQNLAAAGCDRQTAEEFLAYFHSKNRPKQFQLLEAQRKLLLETMHLAQKRIDCLDYLVYQLEKEDRPLSAL